MPAEEPRSISSLRSRGPTSRPIADQGGPACEPEALSSPRRSWRFWRRRRSLNQCEAFITLLDQKMADQELSEEQMAELRRLRDEGQRMNEQGQHEASMEALERAEMMLVPARFRAAVREALARPGMAATLV
jgi:hypothetical protein